MSIILVIKAANYGIFERRNKRNNKRIKRNDE